MAAGRLRRVQVRAMMFGGAQGQSPRVLPIDSPSMSGPADEPLCIVTVHAHPDDEASKGAPTLARYKALGVRTVLVCCTGGEEGDVQNAGLREVGGPFHGLSPEEEKLKLAEVRMLELAESARII